MKPAPFVRTRLVRFSDCDPAGIIFYPQYFVIFNGLVEDWFNEGLGIGYARAITERRLGWPTIHLGVEFNAVSRMGEEVDLSLEVEHLGTRSLILRLRCTGHDGVVRMTARQVLVAMSVDTYASVDIPPDIRAAIAGSTRSFNETGELHEM